MSNLQIQSNALSSSISVNNSVVSMSSVELVELINKYRADNGHTVILRHSTFMEKVRKEVDDGILAEQNILLGEYLDGNSQKRPMYQLDKEASIYMVSGEIGQVRMAIIRRLQELEDAKSKPLSPMEMVIWSAQQTMRIEAEQAEQAKKIKALTGKVEEIDAKSEALLSQSGYYTVMGYSRLVSIRMTNERARAISLALGKICKSRGIVRGETKDPRFGTLFTYPIEILEEYFVDKDIK